jgi:hypothetical protein
VLCATFRPATPLSQTRLGPEALRLSITADLPFSNEEVFIELQSVVYFLWVFLQFSIQKVALKTLL